MMSRMFKIVDMEKLGEMGFVKKNADYVYYAKVDGAQIKIFTVYAGSQYLRFSKTGYTSETQLKCIYDWAKGNYIEWEE